MNQRRALVSILAAMGCLFAGALASSCAKDLNATVQDLKCPSRDVFETAAVSTYMEKRCGTMDCHGAPARPMRLYGRLGLRLGADPNSPAAECRDDNIAGGKATTICELDANYTAVCGVEPEKMDQQAKDSGNSAEQLLMVRKMRGQEKHKGGKITNEGDHPDNCVLGWLRLADPKDLNDTKYVAAKAAVKTECDKALAELQ